MLSTPSARLTLGRPWLTLAIDVCTPIGSALSCLTPDAVGTLRLAHSFARGVITDGLPGRPQDCHALFTLTLGRNSIPRRWCADARNYGVQLEHRPPGQPHFGGHIERSIGTMMGAVHLLPGTTFSSVSKRGTYESEERARLTMPELERWLTLQISGVYHLSIIQRSVERRWRSGRKL